MPCGSMGPTTANRMDPYVDLFQSHGGSMVMIAKGNRTQQVTDACKKHGGFYLGSIGGPAAILSQQSIKSIECEECPELGMEDVWKIEVVDFPAFILVDDKGNDFFQKILPGGFAQDSSCPALLRIPLSHIMLRIQVFHLLWMNFPDHSAHIQCTTTWSYNPGDALPQRRFGLFPVRSPLLRESLFIFSSSRY